MVLNSDMLIYHNMSDDSFCRTFSSEIQKKDRNPRKMGFFYKTKTKVYNSTFCGFSE